MAILVKTLAEQGHTSVFSGFSNFQFLGYCVFLRGHLDAYSVSVWKGKEGMYLVYLNPCRRKVEKQIAETKAKLCYNF